MKVDSKRRWKARILEGRDIPTYVTTYYPELSFWLLKCNYNPSTTHWIRKEMSDWLYMRRVDFLRSRRGQWISKQESLSSASSSELK